MNIFSRLFQPKPKPIELIEPKPVLKYSDEPINIDPHPETMWYGELVETSPAFNVRIDEIYFIESKWNSALNKYVRSHWHHLQEQVNKQVEADDGFWPMRLQYVERDMKAIFRKMGNINPELYGVRFIERQHTPEEVNDLLRDGRRMKDYHTSTFIARVMPIEGVDEYRFIYIDLEYIDYRLVEFPLAELVHNLICYNKACANGRPYHKTLWGLSMPIQSSTKPDDRRSWDDPDAERSQIKYKIDETGFKEWLKSQPSEEERKRYTSTVRKAFSVDERLKQADRDPYLPDEERYESSGNTRFRMGTPTPEEQARIEAARRQEELRLNRLREESKAAYEEIFEANAENLLPWQEEVLRDEEKRRCLIKIKDGIKALQRQSGITIWDERLAKSLLEQLQEQRPYKEAKLTIDERYRILLPQYNMEIKMTTLPKALYILWLRHPEGIHRKDLEDHKAELRRIYLTLSNRTDLDKLDASIEQLVVPGSESLNQKISVINAAFCTALAADLAAPYLITGPRGEAKRVSIASQASLPQSL